MKQLRLLFLMLLLISAGYSVQAKKVMLQHNLKPGMEFSLLVTLNQEIAQDVMGQSQIINNLIETRYLIRVLEKTNDGNYLMEQQTDGMKMVMENDFININFNSDDEGDPPAELALMVKTLHVPVKFILNTRGEIIEITDAEVFMAKMQEVLNTNAGPMQQMVTGMAAQSGSLEGLKSQFSSLFIVYPADKIKVGDSWNQETESIKMVKFKNIIENTLVEANKESASIKQTVNIEQLAMLDGMEMEGMKMNYEMSGRKSAGYEIDMSTGLILKVDAVTDISGIVSIESPQLATPMSIPMTLKMTETIILIK